MLLPHSYPQSANFRGHELANVPAAHIRAAPIRKTWALAVVATRVHFGFKNLQGIQLGTEPAMFLLDERQRTLVKFTGHGALAQVPG